MNLELQIHDLSNTQIRYIFEEIRRKFMPEISQKLYSQRAKVNYEFAQGLLLSMARHSEEARRYISEMIQESETAEASQRVVAWEPNLNEVLITGIVCFALFLINEKNRQVELQKMQLLADIYKIQSKEKIKNVFNQMNKINFNNLNLIVPIEKATFKDEIKIIFAKYNLNIDDANIDIWEKSEEE